MAEVLTAADQGIFLITLNRPEKLNAINVAMRRGLRQALEHFEADASLKVAILTGAGDRAFSAGMDLAEAADAHLGVPPRDFLPVIGQSVSVSKPTIAAVNGVAYAGGWLLMQMCDLAVAASHARFAITEAKVGRGMPWMVPLLHMIPQRVVLEVALTGEPLSAQRAHEVGLVNRVVPASDLLPAARQLAATIRDNAPLTVRAARRAVLLAAEMGRSAALEAAQAVFEPVYRSQDAQEGMRAFRDRRPPHWLGQ